MVQTYGIKMAALMQINSLQVAKKQTICATNAAIQICYYSSQRRIIKNPTTAALKRGTGGRSSFSGIVCTVFGSTGFVGKYVCHQLGRIGTQLILPYRGDMYDCMGLKLCGDLGQVLFHPFDLRDEESIRRCIKYSNVVVNLIGREWETRNFDFFEANEEGSRTLARLSKEANVERFIHLSCLNADPDPEPCLIKSKYLKSKWAGELAVKEEFPEATIIRPAVIYGQEDRFLNAFIHFWRRHLTAVPLWKRGEATEKQPVWVSDVAAGIVAAILNPDAAGKTYQFVGPKRYKLSELVNWFLRHLNRRAPRQISDLRLSFKLKVHLTEFISLAYPLGYLHMEGLEKIHTTDVVLKDLPTLEDLGITPTAMEKRIPWEMRHMRQDGHYYERVGEIPMPVEPKTVAIM